MVLYKNHPASRWQSWDLETKPTDASHAFITDEIELFPWISLGSSQSKKGLTTNTVLTCYYAQTCYKVQTVG